MPDPDNLLVLPLWPHLPFLMTQSGSCGAISALGRLLQKGPAPFTSSCAPIQTPFRRLLEVSCGHVNRLQAMECETLQVQLALTYRGFPGEVPSASRQVRGRWEGRNCPAGLLSAGHPDPRMAPAARQPSINVLTNELQKPHTQVGAWLLTQYNYFPT